MPYTNDSKQSSSFDKDTKPSLVDNALLKEDEGYLLLENGGKILIQDSVTFHKASKLTSVYTNQSK